MNFLNHYQDLIAAVLLSVTLMALAYAIGKPVHERRKRKRTERNKL